LRSVTVTQAEHDRNWNAFLSQLKTAEARSGRESVIADGGESRKANFLAYLALSLLCFPFLAYWYYAIENKTEHHLQEQWRSEDRLAKGML
jgi:hypothetical protein